MATYPSELNVGDDSIENVAVADKETWDSTQQVQSSKYLKYLEKYRQFLRLLQESSKIDLKTAHKMMSMIKSENGEDGLENMSKASFLVKAKFILKHDMQNQPPFCPFCLKKFINTKDRNSHVKILHENIDKKFRCNSCSKTFMSKTALKYHMKVSHSGAGKVVECTQCDVTFSHTMSLKRHMKSIHNDTTGIYECPYCQKTFKRKDYVKVHCKLVHKRVDVSVDMVDTLKQDDDSYKCKCCGEVFLGSSADKDIIAHLVKKCKSEDNFPCSVCHKCFSSKSNMEQHKKNIHSEEPRKILSCDQCDFVTIHKPNLSQHKKRKHAPICYRKYGTEQE